MDIKDGLQRMAPVVLPRKGGATVARDGYRTDRMTPPFVAPQCTLTLDDLNSRGFGEALYSSVSAEQRAARIIAQDLMSLNEMHDRREEYIAAQCMLNNGYVLPQYSDQYPGEFVPYEIHFFDGVSTNAAYTPTTPWNDPGADILSDLSVMVRMLTSKGKPVSDLISSPDVIDQIFRDERILKLLDNRRIEIGLLAPDALPNGVSYYGTLNAGGHNLKLYSYDAEYVDDITGDVLPLMPSGYCVLTAPNAGRAMYGAVKQMDLGSDTFRTYAGTRVPKVTADYESETRTLKLRSRPLLAPRYVDPWVSANVLA